jgi:hypothetical protein
MVCTLILIHNFNLILIYMKYLAYYIFFSFIVLFFAYVNSLNSVESFTPKINEFYRPYIRKARVFSENFYTKQKNSLSNLFRKFGII